MDTVGAVITLCFFVFYIILLFMKGSSKPTPKSLLVLEKTKYYATLNAEIPKISAALAAISQNNSGTSVKTTKPKSAKKAAKSSVPELKSPEFYQSKLKKGLLSTRAQ